MTALCDPIRLADGYEIPKIINGGWQLALGHGQRGFDEREVIQAMYNQVAAGFTTFDCADIYTGVEALLGKFLKYYRKNKIPGHRVRIHTKYVPNLDQLANLTQYDTVRAIDRSLKRLGVDCLDLVQFHWWDYAIPGYVETVGYLADLQKAGKIRLLGLTNFDVAHLREIVESGAPIATHQVQYSLLDRRPEHGMADYCIRHGIHLLCYGALAGGFLSDRYWRADPPDPPFENRSLAKYRLIIDAFGGWSAFQELLGLLRRLAVRSGANIANMAAAAILQRPGVAAVILGTRHSEHLKSNLKTQTIWLDEKERLLLTEFLARYPGAGGDTFSLERIVNGPHAAIMKTNLN